MNIEDDLARVLNITNESIHEKFIAYYEDRYITITKAEYKSLKEDAEKYRELLK